MDRAESGPVECRAARDDLVTLIMQKLAVEWRSTLSSVGHSRVLVECQSTLYALPRSTRLYRVECRRSTPQLLYYSNDVRPNDFFHFLVRSE